MISIKAHFYTWNFEKELMNHSFGYSNLDKCPKK